MDLIQAEPEDAIELAEIRAAAMRPSLEALGRYDAQRVRKRFLDTYVPADTFKILHQGALAGLYVIRDKGDHLYLDHLYILLKYQNLRLGKAVVEYITRKAQFRQLPLRLGALRGSPANAFYIKHGFIQTHEDEFDIYYALSPIP
ncbi:GCN5 family acetyltransferase [Serratia sp. Leaf50]|nr:GCN5 family acetyltransferase [Serratia sp. Leaf50]